MCSGRLSCSPRRGDPGGQEETLRPGVGPEPSVQGVRRCGGYTPAHAVAGGSRVGAQTRAGFRRGRGGFQRPALRRHGHGVLALQPIRCGASKVVRSSLSPQRRRAPRHVSACVQRGARVTRPQLSLPRLSREPEKLNSKKMGKKYIFPY